MVGICTKEIAQLEMKINTKMMIIYDEENEHHEISCNMRNLM